MWGDAVRDGLPHRQLGGRKTGQSNYTHRVRDSRPQRKLYSMPNLLQEDNHVPAQASGRGKTLFAAMVIN